MPSYPGHIQSKLPHIGTTIFTVMSRLAAEHKAINLSQGFPDFDCTPELRALVTKHFNAGVNQYPPMAGIAPLREAVAPGQGADPAPATSRIEPAQPLGRIRRDGRRRRHF